MSPSADICEFPALMSQSCMQQVYDWVELVYTAWRFILHEANFCGVELDKLLEGGPKAFDFLTEGGFASCPQRSASLHHASFISWLAEVVHANC